MTACKSRAHSSFSKCAELESDENPLTLSHTSQYSSHHPELAGTVMDA